MTEGDRTGDDVIQALRLDDLQELCLSLEDLCSKEALCPLPGSPLSLGHEPPCVLIRTRAPILVAQVI